MFLYEITHRYLKNDYRLFDTLKTKDLKTRGNYDLWIKIEWSSPLSLWLFTGLLFNLIRFDISSTETLKKGMDPFSNMHLSGFSVNMGEHGI